MLLRQSAVTTASPPNAVLRHWLSALAAVEVDESSHSVSDRPSAISFAHSGAPDAGPLHMVSGSCGPLVQVRLEDVQARGGYE